MAALLGPRPGCRFMPYTTCESVMAAKRHVAELLISGCTNTAVGVYVALFGTPLAMFIGIVAAGVGCCSFS